MFSEKFFPITLPSRQVPLVNRVQELQVKGVRLDEPFATLLSSPKVVMEGGRLLVATAFDREMTVTAAVAEVTSQRDYTPTYLEDYLAFIGNMECCCLAHCCVCSGPQLLAPADFINKFKPSVPYVDTFKRITEHHCSLVALNVRIPRGAAFLFVSTP